MPFIDFRDKQKVKIWEGIYGSLAHSDQVTFGHITLEEGVVLPEHHHIHEQWTYLIQGKLEFNVMVKKITHPGMTAFIPSSLPHSAKVITECKVIDCFLPVRQDFIELENDS